MLGLRLARRDHTTTVAAPMPLPDAPAQPEQQLHTEKQQLHEDELIALRASGKQ